MPWNSTKNGINTDHPLFQHIRPALVPLVTHFSTLSRRLKDDWEQSVYRYKTGDIEDIRVCSVQRQSSCPSTAASKRKKAFIRKIEVK